MTDSDDELRLSVWERWNQDLAAQADPDTNAAFDAIACNGKLTMLGQVLNDVVRFLDRFMALSEPQLEATALWVAATHASDDFDVVPYLFVTSPEKRSGKTLLLDLLEHLVRKGRPTANISPAALYRLVSEQKPTLLIDEVDTIFAAKGRNVDPAKTDLAGLINAGYRKGRPAYRMGGANMRTLEAFDAFGPKALAGIGNCLPDTVGDRCVTIRLARKAREVTKERYRIRLHEASALDLGENIALAVGGLDLRDDWPDLPDHLNDRQQDIWEPLLAIADAAGGDWPIRARRAALALHRDNEDDSQGVRLLTDVRTVFTTDKLLTKHLVSLLNDLEESPWSTWRSDKGMSSVHLVNMLKPYGIRSRWLRADDDKGRGFERSQFEDAFRLYLVDSVDTVDNEAKVQVNPVHTRVHTVETSVDTSVDAPDQPKQANVHGVHGVYNTYASDDGSTP